MADYIYTMETRLTPEQMRAVNLVQDLARAQGINLYLTGGTMRDILTGFPIRDLNLTLQGNPHKLQKELERHGARIVGSDEDTKKLLILFPGNVRAELVMAHTATFDKPGKAPVIAPSAITEHLRNRDFTVNAMGLSLNPGSRGLFLDPANGAADIESKVIRVLHNYAFLEDPVRLIRATRLTARFHWTLEERTQARYESAKENKYIEHVNTKLLGAEIERLAYEDDPLNTLRSLEHEGWMAVLHPHWSVAKVDTNGLAALLKTKQQLAEVGVPGDPAAAVMYFLTGKLSEKETAEIQKMIPNKHFVEMWRGLEDDAKELSKKLSGKEATTTSKTWDLISQARPETLMFLAATVRQPAVDMKIKNYFGKWRQLKEKLPFPEMAELLITPSLAEYPKIADEAFHLLLDGKLRSHGEIMKFLKPFAPPPPPPPPPPKRGRGAKAAEAPPAAAAPAPTAPVKGGLPAKGIAPVKGVPAKGVPAKTAVKGKEVPSTAVPAKGVPAKATPIAAKTAQAASAGTKTVTAGKAEPAKSVKAAPSKNGTKPSAKAPATKPVPKVVAKKSAKPAPAKKKAVAKKK